MNHGFILRKYKARWGYVNYFGERVIPFKYDFVGPFRNGLGAVCLNNKWGLIDNMGDIQLPIIYDEVRNFSKDFYAIRIEKFWGILDKNKKTIIPNEYNKLYFFDNGYFILKDSRIWKFFDNHCCLLSQFDQFNDFEYIRKIWNRYAIIELNFKQGIIDYNGNIIVHACFDEIIQYRSHFLAGKLKYMGKNRDDQMRFDLYNLCGEKITKVSYQYIDDFCENIAIVKNEGKYGAINFNGSEVISCIYEQLDSFNCGFAKFVKNEKIENEWFERNGFVNIFGEEYYINAKKFCEGLAKSWLNGYFGFINIKGEFIIPPVYEDVKDFKQGLSFAKIKNKFGIIDKNNSFVIAPIWDKIEEIHDEINVLIVCLIDKYGLINLQGNILIPPVFEEIIPLRKYGKSYMVKSQNKYGVYKIGSVDSPILLYDKIMGYSYVDNVMAVCKENLWGMVNGDGDEITPCRYTYIPLLLGATENGDRMTLKYFKNRLLPVFKNQLTLIINKMGNEITDEKEGLIAYNNQDIFSTEELIPLGKINLDNKL